MSKSVLAPMDIFKAYQSKNLSLDLAIDYLTSYIDYGLKDQRVAALNFLGQIPQDSKIFNYLTNLVISDTNNYLRVLSIEIVIKKKSLIEQIV